MADAGVIATEKIFDNTRRKLKKVYGQAEKELESKLQDFVRKFEQKDKLMRSDLIAERITESEYKYWLRGQVFQSDIWKSKVNQAAATLLDANKQAMHIINHDKMDVFAENVNFQEYRFEHDAGMNFGFKIYDIDTVQRLIDKEPELLPRKTVNGRKDKAWNRKKIANAVTQGIIQGESIPQLAKRLAKDTSSSNMEAMTRYARTAMTGAQNAGRIETMNRANEAGIPCKKQWLSTLDGRTRDSHRDLDGQIQEVNDPFRCHHGDIMYPGDPGADPSEVYNCRCTLIYVHDDVDYQHIRRDGNNELWNNVTYREWEQMGYERDDSLKDMSFAQWLKMKENREREQGSVKFTDTGSVKPRARDAEVARMLGVEKQPPMEITDAMYGAQDDALYDKQVGNCQRVIQAYEMRRRGLPVVARDEITVDDPIYWGTECFKGGEGLPLFSGKLTKNDIEKIIDDAPDDARFFIYNVWSNGTAHDFVADKAGGMVYYIDPAERRVDVRSYFNRSIDGEYRICRVDNRELTDDENILKLIVRSE